MKNAVFTSTVVHTPAKRKVAEYFIAIEILTWEEFVNMTSVPWDFINLF